MKKIGILTLVLCLICPPQTLAMKEAAVSILGWFLGGDEDNKIEKNENLNKKSGSFVGFRNWNGTLCYFNALLSFLIYSEPFASVLLLYKKDICTIFEAELKKFKSTQFGDEEKKKLLNYARFLTGMAKNNENGGITEEEKAWDELLAYFKEPKQVSILKPLIQSFFLVELLRVAVEVHDKKVTKAISHRKLVPCLSILGNFNLEEQQDSSEAANVIFGALELIKDENKQPVLQTIFGFGIREKFKCLSCGEILQNKSNNIHYYMLPISFPAGASGPVTFRNLLKENDFYGKKKPSPIQLKIKEPVKNYLWEIFFSNTKKNLLVDLTQSDKIFEAKHCGEVDCPRIRFNSFVANCGYLPELLCIHLKRYDDFGIKKETPVQMPFEFNIDEYLESGGSDGGNYRLKSVILHGGYCDSGHYTSWVRIGKKWHEFNDSDTLEVDKESVKKVVLDADYSDWRSPAMLLYERYEK